MEVEHSLSEALRRPSSRAAGVEEARTVASSEEGDNEELEKPAKLKTARRTSSTPTKPRQRGGFEGDDDSMTGAERMSREAKRRRTCVEEES